MVRWWRTRSWEQKLGLTTLVVTVLGTLIVPVYLAGREDSGGPRTDTVDPGSGAPPSSATLAPDTVPDPTAGTTATSGTEAEPTQPLTPDGKVVRYLSDMERVEGEYAEPGAFSINGVAHAHSVGFTQYLTSYATEYDLGRAFDLDIPVGGVLRLRLVATPVHAQSVRVFSTWGDARLLGDPAKVPPTT